jgi:KUP system potassium uptake protein
LRPANIQTTWIFVKTALVANYMGQGAWLLQHQGMLLDRAQPVL